MLRDCGMARMARVKAIEIPYLAKKAKVETIITSLDTLFGRSGDDPADKGILDQAQQIIYDESLSLDDLNRIAKKLSDLSAAYLEKHPDGVIDNRIRRLASAAYGLLTLRKRKIQEDQPTIMYILIRPRSR